MYSGRECGWVAWHPVATPGSGRINAVTTNHGAAIRVRFRVW
jgi:hypothetical protein